MTLCVSASFWYLTAITTVGLCIRPEKVDSMKKMFSAASAAPCGLEVFETLSIESTLGDARALFLSGCEEKYTSDQCNFAAEDLWFGLDLASTSGLEMDSDLCETLRHAVSASERASLTQNSEKAVSVEASISRKLRRSKGLAHKDMKDIQVSQQSNPQCTNPENLTKHLLPETGIDGGRCMDGTSAGFYYGYPSGSFHASRLWVIFLEGGGACYTKEECDERAGTIAGSNSTWNDTMQIGDKCGPGKLRFLSNDTTYNQYFHNAHHVYVPYCTGDTHAGTRSSATNETWWYHFDGHLNFKAIVAKMIATLPSPTRVLLYGTSAGGKGTFHNCEWLRQHMNIEGRSANVSCAPHSGWFMPGNASDRLDDPQAPPTHFQLWKDNLTDPNDTTTKTIVALHQTYLMPACTSAHPGEEWRCYSVHVFYRYILAPVFVFQDIFDTNKIMAQGGLPARGLPEWWGREYIAYFGRAMMDSTDQVAHHPFGKTKDALFLASCFMHGSSRLTRLGRVCADDDPDDCTEGWHKDDAIADWFWSEGEGAIPNILIDDCAMDPPGLPCNTRCDGVDDYCAQPDKFCLCYPDASNCTR